MKQIQYDKYLHFISGLCISIILGFVFNIYYGLCISIVAGILKELYDYYDYGKFDYIDMLFTWLGGVLGFILLNYKIIFSN